MSAGEMGEALGTIMAREVIPLIIGIWLGNKVYKNWKNNPKRVENE